MVKKIDDYSLQVIGTLSYYRGTHNIHQSGVSGRTNTEVTQAAFYRVMLVSEVFFIKKVIKEVFCFFFIKIYYRDKFRIFNL